jgi:transposase
VETFDVSMPSIKRWLRLRRGTGGLEPRKDVPGPPERKGAALKGGCLIEPLKS